MVMPSSKKIKNKKVMLSCINFHFILNYKMVAWRMGNVREKYSLCYISLIFFFFFFIMFLEKCLYGFIIITKFYNIFHNKLSVDPL